MKQTQISPEDSSNHPRSITRPTEQQQHQLEERIAFLEKQNEELRQENGELRLQFPNLSSSVATNNTASAVTTTAETIDVGKKGCYRLVTLTDGLPVSIDPRDTVARRCCSKRVCAWLWALYRNKVVGMVRVGVTCLGLVSGLLSLVGDYSALGYLCVPVILESCFAGLHMNIPKLRAVITTFNFLGIFALTLATWAGIAVAVWLPERGFGRPSAAMSSSVIIPMALLAVECGTPTKKKSLVRFFTTLWIALTFWTGLLLWYTGSWVNVKQTIVPVGSVFVDVQSIAMSAMVTLAVIFSKMAWSAFWSTEINPGVILHATIAYKPDAMTEVVSLRSSAADVKLDGDV